MKWQIPPRSGEYKLVATRKYKDDIILVVLCPYRKEYIWNNVPQLHNDELRNYLLSLGPGIEKGIYDIELLEKELNG